MALSSGDVSAVCGEINSKGKEKSAGRFGEPDSKLKISTISGDIKGTRLLIRCQWGKK